MYKKLFEVLMISFTILRYFEQYSIINMQILGKNFHIREYGSTLYVRLVHAVSPTNTNFRLTFLLTRLQEALYEDLAV